MSEELWIPRMLLKQRIDIDNHNAIFNLVNERQTSHIISLMVSTSLETPNWHCILQIFSTSFIDKVKKTYNMRWKLPMKCNLVM